MNRGKEPPLSLCEKKFVLEAIKESKRLDGREVYDYRNVDIVLGSSPGHVEVKLGDTKVFVCVSCHVIQPRPQRPTEGQLHFNVELSPMASPAFEIGRPSSVATEITRTLERCVKESRALDTESLCIIAGEKVWEVRVDVHVLDHCGNIIDCAAMGTIAALKHFRRPDITVIGEEATIHPVTERDPVPLSVHHMPLCFTFAFYHGGERLLVDPSLAEEGVMEGRLVIGMNIHREICALQMTGGVAIEQDQVLRCTQIAAVKCIELTEIIKRALSGLNPKSNEEPSILRTKQPVSEVGVPEKFVDESVMEVDSVLRDSEPEIIRLDANTVELGMGGKNTWTLPSVSSNDEVTPLPVAVKDNTKKKTRKKKASKIRRDSNSEEEDTVTVTAQDLHVKHSASENVKEGEQEKISEDAPEVTIVEGGQKKSSRTKNGGAGKKTKGQAKTTRQKKAKDNK